VFIPEPKRTLFVIFNLNSAGGTQKMMFNYLNLLGEKGYKPILYLYASEPDTGLQNQLNNNIKCYNCQALGKFKHWKRIKLLRRIIKKENINNIISFATNGAYLALIAQMFRIGNRIPVIYRMVSVDSAINDLENKTLSRFMSFIYARFLIPKVQYVISQTREMGSLLAEKNPPVFEPKIKPIRNFLNPEAILQQANKDIQTDLPYILYVGRLSEEKNVDKIIDAFSIIHNKIEQKLMIIGDGIGRTKLEKQVIDLGLEQQVMFMGKQPNPYKYMQKAKLLVLFSRYEGFPNVLLEAMVCQTPVITSEFSGVNEIVTHQKDGFVVENANIDALSETMLHLLLDPGLMKRISEEAYSRVIEKNENAKEKYLQLAV